MGLFLQERNEPHFTNTAAQYHHLFFIPLPPTLPDKMKTKAEVVTYLNAKTLSAVWPRGQSSDDWAVDCI